MSAYGWHDPGRRSTCILTALITILALAAGHAPAHKHHVKHHRRHHSRYTGYVVEGRTSTFGYLTGDSEGSTADAGRGGLPKGFESWRGTARPCIATRASSKLDHWFEVTVRGHHAKLLDCDWGPASWTGRAIDITGLGDQALGFSPSNYPTEAWGVARELR